MRRALALAALALLAAAPPPPATPAPAPAQAAADEIVVTGSERKCRIVFADRTLSISELDARADQWAAGTPVRVILPPGASRKCMIRIGMRLVARGVKRVDYIDRQDAAVTVQ